MKYLHIVFKIRSLIIVTFFISCDLEEPKIKSFNDYPIKPVPFTEVQIEDNFWKKRIRTNDEVTIPATFKKSEETGRISNFAKAGGLEKGELEGIFFNYSDVFKIIEGASYS